MPSAAGEERDRVGDQCVGLPGRGPARGDECGDALQSGDEEQAEAFRVARRKLASLLSLAEADLVDFASSPRLEQALATGGGRR